jgi:glycosyltransferase involved in cell wall biosynthesis
VNDKRHIEKFDICFVSSSELMTDARTLNMLRVLVQNNKKICAIAVGSEADKKQLAEENIILFPTEKRKSGRAVQHLIRFTRESQLFKNSVPAQAYWACDLYALYAAKKLAKSRSVKLIYDSREIYSAVGSLSSNPMKQKLQTAFEKSLVKHVDQIVVSGEMDAEYLKGHFKKNIPYDVIMNLPPYKEPVESDFLRGHFNIPANKKILAYQGVLLAGRGLIPVIESLKFNEDFVFCILGEGPYRATAEEHARKAGVSDRVFFYGQAPYDELHAVSCSADIAIVFIEAISFSYKLALPNKLFESCMAAVPPLVSDLPAMRKVIEDYPYGKLIAQDSSPQAIAEAIARMLEPENYAAYKSECARAAKVFSYEGQVEEILRVVG